MLSPNRQRPGDPLRALPLSVPWLPPGSGGLLEGRPPGRPSVVLDQSNWPRTVPQEIAPPCTPRHIYEPDYAQNHRSACDLSDFVRIRRSPPVQVVLFQFFLFRGARLLLPRGPRTRCTGARRLTTIETEKTKFRPCKISGLLLTRELALCALTTSAGFTESVWSITCMRNQQRASLTHYWLF